MFSIFQRKFAGKSMQTIEITPIGQFFQQAIFEGRSNQSKGQAAITIIDVSLSNKQTFAVNTLERAIDTFVTDACLGSWHPPFAISVVC
jgi:hypothetical protein